MRGVVAILVGGWLCGPALFQDRAPEEGVPVRVKLVNGDWYSGQCLAETFQIRTRLDLFRIRLDRIWSIRFGDVVKEEPDRVESNDATLRGFADFQTLKLRTPYGTVEIPRKDLLELYVLGPESRSLKVRAWIDGKSRLLVKGNQVSWQHISFDRPGLHTGRNEPTQINGVDWIPQWNGMQSQPRSFDSFRLPDRKEVVRLEVVEGRGSVRWIESGEGESFSGMIEFDDEPQDHADWYEVELRR